MYRYIKIHYDVLGGMAVCTLDARRGGVRFDSGFFGIGSGLGVLGNAPKCVPLFSHTYSTAISFV